MGGSSSKAVTTNENNQTIVSENTMNILNEQVNSAIARSTINNSAACKNSIKQSQLIDFSGCKVGGDFTIENVDLNQYVDVVDFTCIQASKVDNQVAQEIMSEIMGKISSGLDSKSLSSMISYAEAEADSGFLTAPWGGSDSDVESTNKYNLSIESRNNTNIQNIVKNSINVEFNVEDVQDCINEVAQEQAIKARNCQVDGSVAIKNIKFNQGVTSAAECLQSKGVSQKITNTAANVLGVVVESETTSYSQTEMEATGKATSKAAGVDDVISAVTGSLTDSLETLVAAPLIASGILALCCCLCIVCIIVLFYFASGDDDSGSGRESSGPSMGRESFGRSGMGRSSLGPSRASGLSTSRR